MKAFLQKLCQSCPNADGTVTYSNWHYCTNPKDFRESKILRHRSDMDGSKYQNTPPDWCQLALVLRRPSAVQGR